MADYVDDLVAVARTLPRPPVLLGWSMGGLVAMMAARVCAAVACVGLAPSAPTRTTDRSVPLRRGTFGAEAYGITSSSLSDQPTMPDLDLDERRIALASLGPESQLARAERAAGIVIEPLPCPLLIVTGTADTFWPRERYRDFPLPAEHLVADGASHWGLVLNRRVLATLVPAVLGWLRGAPG
jgi:pimeloyl-ACP methyl ester carboxylesterase